MTAENNKVLSLKNDYLFKAVYGNDDDDSKFILISLLNKILGRKKNPIVKLEYKNPFQAKEYVEDKETVLDIKAITESNEIIDIEMQIVWYKDMPERLIFYMGGLIRESLKAGETYDRMMTSITICITNSIVYPDIEDFMTEYYVMESRHHFVLSEKCKIYCIELPKVNPQNRPVDELNDLEVCLEYLKHADENKSNYVKALIKAGGKELEMAQRKLEKATQDEILRERAIARETFQRDKLSMQLRAEEAEKQIEEAEKLKAEAASIKAEADTIKAEADTIKAEADTIKAEADNKIKNAIEILKTKGISTDDIEALLELSADAE